MYKPIIGHVVKTKPKVEIKTELGSVIYAEGHEGLRLYDRVDICYDFTRMEVVNIIKHDPSAMAKEDSTDEHIVQPVEALEGALGCGLCGLALRAERLWDEDSGALDSELWGLAPLDDTLWGSVNEALELDQMLEPWDGPEDSD